MKVIFVNRFFYPDHAATSQILSDLVFDLARDGVQVEVVTSRMLYDNAAAALPPLENVAGATVRRIWSSRLGRANLAGRAVDYLTFYLSAAWTVWRRTDASTVVVAKTDPPLLSIAIAPVVRMRKGVLVNWLQDLFPEVAHALRMRLVRGPVLALLRRVRNLSLRAARTNVVLGTRMQALVEHQGIPAAQIRLIPNWADGDQIRPVVREQNPLREGWMLGERFVVGYSGNMGRAHEFDTIVCAAELLRHRDDIVFLFIGSGAQRQQVELEFERRGLRNVLFRPYQARDRLSESLGVADVHLVTLNPALEGLIVPSKFYGVAAAGRPTLFIGDVKGEIPHVLREADCGFAVASGDNQALADSIARLAGDRGLCAAMGTRARAVFDERFERRLAMQAWKTVLLFSEQPEQAFVGQTSP